MIACVGMSTTLHGVMRDLITPQELSVAEFFFSCGRLHVLNNGLIPCEATALNTILPIVFKGQCKLKQVDPLLRVKVLDFIQAMYIADKQGRITWKIGNQVNVINNLPKGSRYFWRKGWNYERH